MRCGRSRIAVRCPWHPVCGGCRLPRGIAAASLEPSPLIEMVEGCVPIFLSVWTESGSQNPNVTASGIALGIRF
jgi:hypothetical protein